MARTAREIKKLHRKRMRRLKERQRQLLRMAAPVATREEEKARPKRTSRRKKEGMADEGTG